MLPLEDTSCILVGCGAIEPSVRRAVNGSARYRLVVAVNRAAEIHGIVPDVTFWQDPIWPLKGETGLSIRVNGLEGPEDGIKLPCWRVGKTPLWLNPGRLYHVANTAVMAAMWAMSVGCSLVAMLGCGCLDDGRRPGQLRQMREDLENCRAIFGDRIHLVETFTDWLEMQKRAEGTRRILYDPKARLRAFYT